MDNKELYEKIKEQLSAELIETKIMIFSHKQELLNTKIDICSNNIKEKEKVIQHNDNLYDTHKYNCYISPETRHEYHTCQEQLQEEKKFYIKELDKMMRENDTYSNEIYNLKKNKMPLFNSCDDAMPIALPIVCSYVIVIITTYKCFYFLFFEFLSSM